ncbi:MULTISPECIES: sulfatase-like hydrolase/transferase [unclassified Lentimonas]|uniref:sulfatase-like hydrolase/transferase n=1 Tax=unclassified Lentimonas TaxID=2630993 RepID=UPI001326DA07|nr:MULTISPECIES: sulfatase-like hydrolase/transferase [unclassified Lentimonas]CAA6689524.1 Unannotated [Lentimonas sp. CC10]CAA6691966.1 Unannotated [Lentimonas sp. CC19]CAA7070554.1 Unannotated [Lentimonas sp. CC11]
MKKNSLEYAVTILSALKVLSLLVVGAAYASAAVEKPNILIIFPDDLGYEAIGAYGGLDYSTPEIDAMAEQGILFTRAYTNPVCTPSRVSLHTGTYTLDHGHTEVLSVHVGTTDKVDFVKWPTFAQLLQADGYATSVTGKWQLATLFHYPDHPLVAGFDSWCVWNIWDGINEVKTSRYYNPAINRDGYIMDGSTLAVETTLPGGTVFPAGSVLPDVTDDFGPDVLHAYVKERMAAAVVADEPFFIMHNMLLPHSPIVAPPSSGGASLGNMIEYMDFLVGELLDEIEALGIRENTYVFFIGDNGTDVGADRMTVDGLVSGGKRDLNDGGMHIPFIVWGPSGITAGTTDDGLVDITDVFPTICGLTNVEIPSSIECRGNSIVPQIHGRPGIQRSWVFGGIDNSQALFDGEWLYVKLGSSTETLFDCRNLPSEVEVTLPGASAENAANARLQSILDFIPSSGDTFEIVLDNDDSEGVAIVGDWKVSSATAGYIGSNYMHDQNTGKGSKSVSYTFSVPAVGNYDVSIQYASGSNRASNVPVTIASSGSSTTVSLNQTVNGGVWFSLGEFGFDAANPVVVTIETTDTDGYVMVDAVKLTYLEDAGYLNWKALNFGLSSIIDSAQEATWGNLADPDGDSIVNLFEYALGLSPLMSTDPCVTPKINVDENGRFVCRAVVRKGDAQTTIAAQVSETLELDSWGALDARFDLVSEPLSAEVDELTFRIKPEEAVPESLFFRVRVE